MRPNRALRPRSGLKFARVSAQYGASPAPLFAYFFWQDRWNQIANQRSVCNLERTNNGTDETCRLRRGEGCGVCEDEPPEARLRFHRTQRQSGANRKRRADRVVGPYKLPRRINCEATVAVSPHQRHSGVSRKYKSTALRAVLFIQFNAVDYSSVSSVSNSNSSPQLGQTVEPSSSISSSRLMTSPQVGHFTS